MPLINLNMTLILVINLSVVQWIEYFVTTTQQLSRKTGKVQLVFQMVASHEATGCKTEDSYAAWAINFS